MDIERQKNKLRNLRQNKNLTEEQLDIMAKEKLDKHKILSNLTMCSNDDEKKMAEVLLEQYLSERSFENYAEIDTLRQLIDMEILAERVKAILKTEYGKANPTIPTHMLQELREINAQVLEFKKSLKLVNDKENSNGLEEWKNLEQKALAYYESHKGCNILKCPYCSSLFEIRMRTENLEAKQAILFRGTVLYNESLYKLYNEKRITVEEMAKIFDVSVNFIELLYQNIYLKESVKV